MFGLPEEDSFVISLTVAQSRVSFLAMYRYIEGWMLLARKSLPLIHLPMAIVWDTNNGSTEQINLTVIVTNKPN
jgi:hypothetical protein